MFPPPGEADTSKQGGAFGKDAAAGQEASGAVRLVRAGPAGGRTGLPGGGDGGTGAGLGAVPRHRGTAGGTTWSANGTEGTFRTAKSR